MMYCANGWRIRGTSLLTDRTITMRYYRKSPVYPPRQAGSGVHKN
jgi:hypothetical protein